MHNFSPFRSMLITHIGIIRFNNDPTFAWAWTVQTLERLGAFGERSPTSQELSSGNFVIASFEWPMHEEGHRGFRNSFNFIMNQRWQLLIRISIRPLMKDNQNHNWSILLGGDPPNLWRYIFNRAKATNIFGKISNWRAESIRDVG